jgi:uncharacterized protein involved in tolerance to divalent cations
MAGVDAVVCLAACVNVVPQVHSVYELRRIHP